MNFLLLQCNVNCNHIIFRMLSIVSNYTSSDHVSHLVIVVWICLFKSWPGIQLNTFSLAFDKFTENRLLSQRKDDRYEGNVDYPKY